MIISTKTLKQYAQKKTDLKSNNQNRLILVYLVGNKFDLVEDKCDINELQKKIEEVARKYKMKLFFTSAKTGQNINKLFKALFNDAVVLENREMKVPQKNISSSSKPETSKCCGA